MVPADGCADVIVRGDRLLIAGPSTRAIAAAADGEEGTVGLRLPPGFVGATLRISAAELTDRVVELTDVVPAGTARQLRAAMLSACGGESGPIDAVCGGLLDRSVRSGRRLDVIRRSARGALPARALAQHLGEAERTLRRRMLADFGYGYATLVRIERAAEAQRLLMRGARASEAAAAAGFSDQAHLTREFRRLVGTTPAQFAGSAA